MHGRARLRHADAQLRLCRQRVGVGGVLQLQQIQLLVNLKQVADPLLGYAETALNNAQKALDEAEPEDEEYTELRDALAKAQAAYDNIKGQLDGYQAQLDAGKQQMYAKGLISSPNLSNTDLVTEAKAETI